MNNIATPHPRCTLTLLSDGRIVCRSTSDLDGQVVGTSRTLRPDDSRGFRGFSYADLAGYLAEQPERHAIVEIDAGQIQIAPRD